MIKNILLIDNLSDQLCTIQIDIVKVFLYSNINQAMEKKLEHCSIEIAFELCLRVSIENEVEDLKYIFILSRFATKNDEWFDDLPDFEFGQKADLLRNFGTDQFKGKKYCNLLNQFTALIDSQKFPRDISPQEASLNNLADLIINFSSYKDFVYVIDEKLEIVPENLFIRIWMFESINEKNIKEHINRRIREFRLQKDILFTGSFDAVQDMLRNQKSMQSLLAKRKKSTSDFDYRDYTNWTHYDDNLDNDQQGPEFWNQF
jgi:hypothetical protein